MIIITVTFTAVEIVKYARNEPLTIKILFNDGSKEHSFEKITNFDKVEEFSIEVMNEARKIEKELNAGSTGRFLDDVVQVRFGDDEEKSQEKLNNVFRRIRDDVKNLKRPDSPRNYLQKTALIQKARYPV